MFSILNSVFYIIKRGSNLRVFPLPYPTIPPLVGLKYVYLIKCKGCGQRERLVEYTTLIYNEGGKDYGKEDSIDEEILLHKEDQEHIGGLECIREIPRTHLGERK